MSCKFKAKILGQSCCKLNKGLVNEQIKLKLKKINK